MTEKPTVPVLETARLILWPLALSDMEAVFRWAGDAGEKDFGFVLKESGGLIGSGSIYYHSETGMWRVGYNLWHDHQGCGLATEAME